MSDSEEEDEQEEDEEIQNRSQSEPEEGNHLVPLYQGWMVSSCILFGY